MDDVARWPPRDRTDLFSASAARRGVSAAIIEKDFWQGHIGDARDLANFIERGRPVISVAEERSNSLDRRFH